MTKVSVYICITLAFAIAGVSGNTVPDSRYLSPTVKETAAAPCTMHPQNSTLDSSLDTDSGSLQESGTMSIGSKVFNVVSTDDHGTINVGGKTFKVSDVSRSSTKTYSVST
ncbi:hypothetical protein ON010_g18001 [Phytophthora cinnamomi]|nr:hypothetical protein ON010_g18001 [Phytophthora cinnamomi]